MKSLLRLFQKRNRQLLPLLLICLKLGACAAPSWSEFSSLTEQQPFVLEVTPADGQHIATDSKFLFRFSERLDFSSLQKNSVALLFNPEEKALSNLNKLMENLESGEQPSVAVEFSLDGEEKELSLLPKSALADGVYYLVITPALLSVQGLPFNQSPGKTPQLFVARYFVGSGERTQTTESISPSNQPSAPIFGTAPEKLMIHEFLYDGKTSETDGEAFVELYGSPGADISLYQILFLNGENGEEIDRVTLPPNSILGEDGIFLIADLKTGSTSASGIADPDFVDQFDPQNGPDGIQLLNRAGELLDSVVYGEGAVATATNSLSLGEGLPTLDVTGGYSLSRRGGEDSDDNATDFEDRATPSPGSIE